MAYSHSTVPGLGMVQGTGLVQWETIDPDACLGLV